MAPETQISPGLHSLALIWLALAHQKTLSFSPCLSDPWVPVKSLSKRSKREGPGPDSPAWDYSENFVFEWKACLSELTLANLPLHIQPLLALASHVKRSCSATQTPMGLFCATLLFSFRHFWELEKLSSTPGNAEAARRPTLTTWTDWQRFKIWLAVIILESGVHTKKSITDPHEHSLGTKKLLVIKCLSDKTLKQWQCSITKEVNKREKFYIFKVIVMLHASPVAAFMKVVLSFDHGNSLYSLYLIVLGWI